jgi:uncharacterized membrane protein YhdT
MLPVGQSKADPSVTEFYYYLGLVILLIVGWLVINATTRHGHVLRRRARWFILAFFVILFLVRVLHDLYSYD